MRRSLESSRPILPKQRDQTSRTSNRHSTYSFASSGVLTEKSLGGMSRTSDPRASSEVEKYSKTLDRMESKRLQDQRYTPSVEKDDDMSKLALGAKVQKALDRRLTSQDAEYKPKSKSKNPEKSSSSQSKR